MVLLNQHFRPNGYSIDFIYKNYIVIWFLYIKIYTMFDRLLLPQLTVQMRK